MGFLTNLLAAMAPKLLDWLIANGGKLVVHLLKKARELKEGYREDSLLKDKADEFEDAARDYKEILKDKTATEGEKKFRKERMNDAFKEFVRYRPTKF